MSHEIPQAATPLVELLLGVPVTACWEEGSGEGSDYRWRTVPVGVYCHQAARALAKLKSGAANETIRMKTEECAALRAEVERLRAELTLRRSGDRT